MVNNMEKNSFYLVSLGCAKNTVDSSSIHELLINSGYFAAEKPTAAKFLIVNTCGFIQPARQEAIDTLSQLARNKKKNQSLIAAGCMTERYRQFLIDQVPGIDAMIGTRRWMDILDVINKLRSPDIYPQPVYHLPEVEEIGRDEKGVHRSAIQGGSAYLKIADGCRRPCAFCSIPLIKGIPVSRQPEAIVKEAQYLESVGVQELVLIAQDTTDYGVDLGLKDGLPDLIQIVSKAAPTIPWIRVLYTYPGYVTDKLIYTMAETKQVLPYLDIPLQHGHPDVLRRMRRPANIDWVYNTIAKMRSIIPSLALRTTFIVGYPGESEAEFETLLSFINDIRFDHVGVFPFSFEPGTESEPLGDPIPMELKQERISRLMALQEEISLSRNQSFIGAEQQVLIEGYGQGVSIGRAYHDAPEIDGLVFIHGKVPVGRLVNARITGAMTHDLTAELMKGQ